MSIGFARRNAAIVLFAMLSGGCQLPSSEDMHEPGDDDHVAIGRVQGSGGVSPMQGQEVAIEGIVVRSLMGDGDDLAQAVGETLGEGNRGKVVGWFVQGEGDGDAVTSDALFVQDDAYNTSIGMPDNIEYTMRVGSLVRTGDRVKVRGTVTELPQETAADLPRSSGHRVGRGDPAGTVTAILARSITLLGPSDRKQAIMLETVPLESADEEAVEGMRLQKPKFVRSP